MFPKPTPPPLTLKQQRALTALLNGRTRAQAAADAKISLRTLTRWLADPTFRAHLTIATDTALANATHRLAGILDEAVTTIAEVMADKEARHQDRLRAAGLTIRRGLDLVHQTETLERIAALEAKSGLDPL